MNIACTRVLVLCCMLLAIIAGGCLVSEREEYHLVLNKDGRSGTLVFTKYNIQSNADDSAGQQRDFDEMIANWKSDQYLLDQMDHGAYVKGREMRLDDGKIVWKELSIFSDVKRLFPEFNTGDTIRFSFNPAEMEITETNGSVVSVRESTMVVWPPGTREFVLTTKNRSFTAKSSFAEKFASYLKEHP